MQGSILMRIDRDMPMEMRDGTKLRADFYRPDDGQKHPAILMRAYRKLNQYSIVHDFIDGGYAFISQVSRGRGTSEGEWRPQDTFAIEGLDGYDSVEWIASQSWCDGSVGMFGASHETCRQWLAALENPPHLKAIAQWTG